MTRKELRQIAMECLAKALKGTPTDPHIVQTAVSILMMPKED